MSEQSIKDQQAKVTIIAIFANHKNNCINMGCVCHSEDHYIFSYQLATKRFIEEAK